MSASRNKALAGALAFLWLLFGFQGAALADVFRVGDYTIQRGDEPNSFELSATVPEVLANNDPLGLPEGCREAERDRVAEATAARFSITIDCDRALEPEDRIITPWPVDGGTFTSTATGERVKHALQPDGDVLALPFGESAARTRALPEIAVEYTWQGILHILGGWDHLAFVLCLCLLVQGRFLLVLITTFTAGHSLSLALAFFDVVKLPVPPVEAIIALSIAFMAREAIGVVGNEIASPARRRRQLAIIASFGLLHGLGFASVLREIGVPPAERVSGLLFFNGGVELGQIFFVACVLTVMALARAAGQQQRVRAAALYGAGIVGCFWAIERVAGFTLGMA